MYSADGLRQRKVDGSGTVNYLWDETRLQQETNESLVEIVRYTQSTAGWDTLISQRRGGVSSFYAFDLNGNTRYLCDIAGNITDTYVNDAFGNERAATGSTLNLFRFAGKVGYMRDGNGLFYVRAREYDSATGTFLTRDPIGFDGGDWNLYRYVKNNPVSGVDPTGLRCPGEPGYDPWYDGRTDGSCGSHPKADGLPPSRPWPRRPRPAPTIPFVPNPTLDGHDHVLSDDFPGAAAVTFLGDCYYGPTWLGMPTSLSESTIIHEHFHRSDPARANDECGAYAHELQWLRRKASMFPYLSYWWRQYNGSTFGVCDQLLAYGCAEYKELNCKPRPK